ncbi:MAG: hypothetical protein R3360_09330, partial [Alphaproteobacteria bacterium]|nr:hypothetical protein [Alphaproteobacteria bacterium]
MSESNYKNRVIRFMERPKGWVDESIFKIEDAPIIEVADGEEARALVRRQLPYHPDFIKIWY